jgi:hypothetical protein
MKSIGRLVLAITTFLALQAIAPVPARAGDISCDCWVTVEVFQYEDGMGAVGGFGDYEEFIPSVSFPQCASQCTNYAISHASSLCDTNNLNNGVGYARISTYYNWNEQPGGVSNVNYDCDSI